MKNMEHALYDTKYIDNSNTYSHKILKPGFG